MIQPLYRQNARTLQVTYETRGKMGRRVQRPADDVRAVCFERLFGCGWGRITAQTPQEMDQRIALGILARNGLLGRDVQKAQMALCAGRDALTELKRIRSLQRRRPAEEAELLAVVKAKFAEAETAMDRHNEKRAAKRNN